MGDGEAGVPFWLLLAIALGLPGGALAVLEGLLSGREPVPAFWPFPMTTDTDEKQIQQV